MKKSDEWYGVRAGRSEKTAPDEPAKLSSLFYQAWFYNFGKGMQILNRYDGEKKQAISEGV